MRDRKLTMALLGLTLAGAAPGQDVRYELGLRVRAFERAFEPRCQEVAVRERVCPSLELAVKAFFGVRLDEVARLMDTARQQLDPAAPPSPAVQWADSLSLRVKSRFVDLETGQLEFELLSAYTIDAERPAAAKLVLRLIDADGKELQSPASYPIDDVPMRAALPLTLEVPGDHRLQVEIRAGETPLARHEQLVSSARDLDARLEAVAHFAKDKPVDTSTATARGLTRMLQSLARGGTRETDVFAARHLGELEQIAAGADSPFSIGKPGDFRIWLLTKGGTVPARLMVPENPAGERVPVVVALHGAGGSENLFFDGYGAGKIVRLCRERGWLLVAPRSGFGGGSSVDAIVSALAVIYPVDRERVFAVGHSMGAAQLMADASAHPEVFAAVAALGGSGSVRPTARLRELPVMVAPGEKDFALGGARRLRDALTDAGVKTVDYREHEATEHLGIVQVALDDVFRFFDRFADRGK